MLGLHIGAFYVADISVAEACFIQCGEVLFYLVVLALQLDFVLKMGEQIVTDKRVNCLVLLVVKYQLTTLPNPFFSSSSVTFLRLHHSGSAQELEATQ